MTVLEEAHRMGPELIALRRALHAQPEIGLDLPVTQRRVLAAIDDLPLEVNRGEDATSVTAVLRGHGPAAGGGEARRAVLLRADMDAVPVTETTGHGYSSQVDGAMHACGHDLHMAMLVGAARLLASRRAELDGDVVLMFQPGEEGWEGARLMLGEGVLEASGVKAEAAYALHVFSNLAHGQFFTRPGPMMAASASVVVDVLGQGGHASMPHRAKDPIPPMAEMITAIQTLITRQFDAGDPVVVTVGVVRAGTRANVIPASAHFEATVRGFSPESMARLRLALPRLCRGIAEAHGLRAEVTYTSGRPVTSNDISQAAFVSDTLRSCFGGSRVHQMPVPMFGSEDFSRVLEATPGCFVALGAAPQGCDLEKAAVNHSPDAVFDDAVLSDGAALYAELALRRLRAPTINPSC